MKVETRVLDIVSAMTKTPRGELTAESSMDSVVAWDSLAHLNIIIAVEEEFDIELDEIEAMELTSVPLLRVSIEEALTK